MDYLQIEIYTTTSGIDPVGAMLDDAGVGGFEIRDSADFAAFLENKTGNWDYIEKELMSLLESETTLCAYLPEGEQGAEMMRAIEDGLARLLSLDINREWGRLTFSAKSVKDQDWANSWKKYYHPVKVGDKLVVKPSWEEYIPADGEVILEMDPGMAFGSGTHPSTYMCLRLLEEHIKGGESVLDVGCGSGILAVGAILLGAGEAIGVDLDEVAVGVAKENALRNRVSERTSFSRGNLASEVFVTFDVICANIVADVIIDFSSQVKKYLREGGVFICSGIIDEREIDVRSSLESNGLQILKKNEEKGWVSFAAISSIREVNIIA